jgi:hypothetical protein
MKPARADRVRELNEDMTEKIVCAQETPSLYVVCDWRALKNSRSTVRARRVLLPGRVAQRRIDNGNPAGQAGPSGASRRPKNTYTERHKRPWARGTNAGGGSLFPEFLARNLGDACP